MLESKLSIAHGTKNIYLYADFRMTNCGDQDSDTKYFLLFESLYFKQIHEY